MAERKKEKRSTPGLDDRGEKDSVNTFSQN